MKTFLAAACMFALLPLAAEARSAVEETSPIKTLPTVQVRPNVGWVGDEHNERVVTLAAVNVRPTALTYLQVKALDVISLIPQLEPILDSSLTIEVPSLSGMNHSGRASIGGL